MAKQKILIAEDELLTRIGIRNLIPWQNHEFQLVGEAEDGEQALKMIEQEHPDILLLDINMPILDGIEVLQEIKTRGYAVKVIVLSCHDEFELVKKALVLGADDYILKNSLNQKELLEALFRVREKLLEEQRNKNYHNVIQNLDIQEGRAIHQSFIANLLSGRQVLTHTEKFIMVREGNLTCISIEICHFPAVKKRYENQDTTLMFESMTSILESALKKYPEHEMVRIKDNRIVLLISFSQLVSAEQTHNAILKISGQFQSLCKTYLNVDIRIGIGGIYHSYQKLSQCYQESVLALSHHFVQKDKLVFDFYGLSPSMLEQKFLPLQDEENRIRKMCIDRQYESLSESIEHYFHLIRSQGVVNPSRVREFVSEIVNIVLINLGASDFSILERIQSAEFLDEIQQLFSEALMQNRVLSSKPQYDAITTRVIQFVQNHYQEAISLAEIADHLQISENHISRVFKKNTGRGIPEFINTFRVEKAKELLRNTDLKIYEIADQTGFQSVSYFNTTFKRLAECTPYEFRNHNGS